MRLLNYRHGFHAGNPADVLKHAVLARILVHLREKPGAFRVLDTHAGAGVYDLSGAEAERGGEWRAGIGRLSQAALSREALPQEALPREALPREAAALLAPYLDAVQQMNPSHPSVQAGAGVGEQAGASGPDLGRGPGGRPDRAGNSAPVTDGTPAVRAPEDAAEHPPLRSARAPLGKLRFYPGSPAVAQCLLRDQDRLVVCETAPDIHAELAAALGRDRRCKALGLDGWAALKAQLPPPERRGVVVIDPPFESAAEVAALLRALTAAVRKWPTGIFMVWYPVTRRSAADVLLEGVRIASLPATLRAELRTARAGPDTKGLGASGVIVVNPPWRLETELAVLLPALAAALGEDDGAAGAFRLDWLRREGGERA